MCLFILGSGSKFLPVSVSGASPLTEDARRDQFLPSNVKKPYDTKSNSESALLLIKLKSFCPYALAKLYPKGQRYPLGLPYTFCLTQLSNIISQQDLV